MDKMKNEINKFQLNNFNISASEYVCALRKKENKEFNYIKKNNIININSRNKSYNYNSIIFTKIKYYKRQKINNSYRVKYFLSFYVFFFILLNIKEIFC